MKIKSSLYLLYTNSYIFEIKDIVYFSMALIGVISTSIFCYLILKVDNKSISISEKSVDIAEQNTKKIFFEIYKNFCIISSITDPVEIDIMNLNEIICNWVAKLFDNHCLEYTCQLSNEFNADLLTILRNRYKRIFCRLNDLMEINSIEDAKIIMTNKYINSNKIRKESHTNGIRFFEIEYKDDKPVHKIIWNNNGGLLADISIVNYRANGYRKKYLNNRLIFEGEIINGKYYSGTSFDDQVCSSFDVDEEIYAEEVDEPKGG